RSGPSGSGRTPASRDILGRGERREGVNGWPSHNTAYPTPGPTHIPCPSGTATSSRTPPRSGRSARMLRFARPGAPAAPRASARNTFRGPPPGPASQQLHRATGRPSACPTPGPAGKMTNQSRPHRVVVGRGRNEEGDADGDEPTEPSPPNHSP